MAVMFFVMAVFGEQLLHVCTFNNFLHEIIQTYDVKAFVIHVINVFSCGWSFLKMYGTGYGRVVPHGVE